MTPGVQSRLAKELAPHQTKLSFADHKDMGLPLAVTNEALRLAPSVGDDFHIAGGLRRRTCSRSRSRGRTDALRSPRTYAGRGSRLAPLAVERVTLPSGMVCHEGARVFLPNSAIGRDPKLWSNPETFDPDRWLHVDPSTNKPFPVKRPDEFVFPVFFGGYRSCLGRDMARFEAVVMMSKLFTRFDFHLVDGDEFDETYVMGPVIFYAKGVKCRVSKRSA